MLNTPITAGVREVLDVVASSPGLTRAGVANHLHGRRTARLADVNAALAAGLLHQAPHAVATRGGFTRSAQGLFPGAPNGGTGSSDEVDVAQWRRAAGLSQRTLAARLAISQRLVRHWEKGTQQVPPYWRQRLRDELQDLEKSTAATATRRRRHQDVVAIVRAHPGLSRRALRPFLGNGASAAAALAQDLAAGLIHEAPSTVVGPHGGLHVVTGLHPGSRPWRPTIPAPSGGQLRRARAIAGRNQAEVARQLGVSGSTLADWERADGRLPARLAEEGAQMLRELLAGARRLEDRVVEEVTRSPGLTLEQLTRGRFGRSSAVLAAVQRVLDDGRLHQAHAQSRNAANVTRAVRGLHPGPAPRRRAALTGPALEQARRTAGLSRPALGALVGVSGKQLAHWESGAQPVSLVRSAQLREALAEAGTALVPYVDPVHLTDDELEQLALQVITAQPGSSQREVVEQMTGDVRRRAAAIRRLLDADRAHLQPTVRRYADGRTFTHLTLFPGPAPPS